MRTRITRPWSYAVLAKTPQSVIDKIFPGTANFTTNFEGYRQQVVSGANAQRDFDTYFKFLPISAIGKGIF